MGGYRSLRDLERNIPPDARLSRTELIVGHDVTQRSLFERADVQNPHLRSALTSAVRLVSVPRQSTYEFRTARSLLGFSEIDDDDLFDPVRSTSPVGARNSVAR